MRWIIAMAVVVAFSSGSFAKVQSKSVSYKHGDVALEGYLAWDDAVQGKRPGVLVIHEWWGLTEYPKKRAEMLAELGYVAFALDMYGKGKIAANPKQAGEWAGHMRGDAQLWHSRAMAGLAQLKASELCDTDRLGAIGYCFGGQTVLNMALSGENLRGVVSFHGAMPKATAQQAAAAKASMLICQGGLDTFVPVEAIESFRDALEKAGADYKLVYYAGATHSWTNPKADTFGMPVKHHKVADQRSWDDMKRFFDEVLKK